ncbi:MAG: hypothetical protein HQL37_08365 [Alphaproteobacteria bacterium]|nr:hypothetical protein [Alphaproteobacteria bacterium]
MALRFRLRQEAPADTPVVQPGPREPPCSLLTHARRKQKCSALHIKANKKQERKDTMTDTAKLTKATLHQFTGSENWYRHGLVRHVLFTDGAKYVADQGGAYWLLDEIAFAQRRKRVLVEEFQVWKLTVKADSTARLVCEDGNGNRVYSKKITYTDFPTEGVELYYTNNTILLPSEY